MCAQGRAVFSGVQGTTGLPQRLRAAAIMSHLPEAKPMKRTLLTTAALLALACPALAQSTTITTPAPSASASVTISPEQRTRIKQYVVEKKVKPVVVKERVAVGATLPADVELAAVPGDWGPEMSRYRYVYSDDRVMLVEPSSRRVVQVID
jgi:hypothetical protein